MSPPDVAVRWSRLFVQGGRPEAKADQGDQISAKNANEQRHFN
jgi:hypothetical protein